MANGYKKEDEMSMDPYGAPQPQAMPQPQQAVAPSLGQLVAQAGERNRQAVLGNIGARGVQAASAQGMTLGTEADRQQLQHGVGPLVPAVQRAGNAQLGTGETQPMALGQQAVNRIAMGQSGPQAGSLMGQSLGGLKDAISRGDRDMSKLAGLETFEQPLTPKDVADRLTGLERTQYVNDKASKDTKRQARARAQEQKFEKERRKQRSDLAEKETKAELLQQQQAEVQAKKDMFTFERDRMLIDDLKKKVFDGKMDEATAMRELEQLPKELIIKDMFDKMKEERQRGYKLEDQSTAPQRAADIAGAQTEARLEKESQYQTYRTQPGLNEIGGGTTTTGKQKVGSQPQQGQSQPQQQAQGQTQASQPSEEQVVKQYNDAITRGIQMSTRQQAIDIMNSPDWERLDDNQRTMIINKVRQSGAE